MAKLSEKKRDSMADSKFGLPEEHKYPNLGAGHRPSPKRNVETVAPDRPGVSPLAHEEQRPNHIGLLHVSPASAGRLLVPVTIGR